VKTKVVIQLALSESYAFQVGAGDPGVLTIISMCEVKTLLLFSLKWNFVSTFLAVVF